MDHTAETSECQLKGPGGSTCRGQLDRIAETQVDINWGIPGLSTEGALKGWQELRWGIVQDQLFYMLIALLNCSILKKKE